jgi:hypothetical protein
MSVDAMIREYETCIVATRAHLMSAIFRNDRKAAHAYLDHLINLKQELADLQAGKL